MKITRYKNAKKTMNFYKNNFDFRKPYQLLIDATFCQMALKHQINIKDQLPKYLQSELRMVTTQCIIVEAENLGAQIQGATQIVKQFLVHRCGHDKQSISAAACIKSMIKPKEKKYIIATQDRDLQERLRLMPGQPIMYLHQRTPVLEEPSEASRKFSDKKMDATVDFNELETKKLAYMRTQAGFMATDEIVKKKKFKKKQPNPLSCKPKKKKPLTKKDGSSERPVAADGLKNIGIQKPARKRRIKIANHIKKELLEIRKCNTKN